MSLESAYLLGQEQEDVKELIRVKTDGYPIIVIKIKEKDGIYVFEAIEKKNSGTVDPLPSEIGGPTNPFLPSLVTKDRLRLSQRIIDNKKKENIQTFNKAISRKIDKLKRSAEKMGSWQVRSISEFGNAVSTALEANKQNIAGEITKWAEASAGSNSQGVNGAVLCVSVNGKYAVDIPGAENYLREEYRKRSMEHSGTKVEGQGHCAWCGSKGDISSRMDYWKPGNVDNPFSAPYGRKGDTYKVIPICLKCHDRLKTGMKVIDDKYSGHVGGGVRVLYGPRILYGSAKQDLRNELQEFWQNLKEDILKFVQIGTSQLSRRGEKVLKLRGISTTVDDLADVLEAECLTFDVTWLRKDNDSHIVLTRAYDVVPTWLLRLAEITDLVNDKNNDTKWSSFAGSSKTNFILDGKHFWSLFKQPSKQSEQAKKSKTKPIRTMTYPWIVASEVLEKRLRPFNEYLPDFFVGVDAYWCSIEEKERKRVFAKSGAERTKIVEWVSLWHRFSFYVHLVRKEMGIMDQVITGSIPAATNAAPPQEEDNYTRKVIDAAVREADEATVYKTKTERGAFLAGIALGILAIYQDQDGKTMRVLDYPGDYRLGETAYKEFLLRFGEKLRDYLYVREFRDSKGRIVQGILSASAERTAGGFEDLTSEVIGFALLSGVLRANYYYYMPGDKTKQGKGGKS